MGWPTAGHTAGVPTITAAGSATTSTTDSSVPVAVNTGGPLGGTTITAISGGSSLTRVRWPTAAPTAGAITANGRAGKQQHHGFERAGAGGHDRATTAAGPSPRSPPGAYHSCAVAEGQGVLLGLQLHRGNSATTAPPARPYRCRSTPMGRWPVRRSPRSPVGPGGHTCAVAEWQACWGSNSSGQLGNNSTTNASVPAAVDTTGRLAGQTVTAITAGGFAQVRGAAAVPQPPTAVARGGRAGDAKVTVSWSAPGEGWGAVSRCWGDVGHDDPRRGVLHNGGNYLCLVSGLTNGTGYTYHRDRHATPLVPPHPRHRLPACDPHKRRPSPRNKPVAPVAPPAR